MPYSLPEIYDIAFDFRNVSGEVDFLIAAAEKYTGKKLDSAIELACGPGYHVREFALRGILSHGVDRSPEMVTYAAERIKREHLTASVFCDDMREFEAPRKYDLAYCLLVSFAHLLTNDDIVRHFNCVADLLNPGGIYVVSTAHPRDFWAEENALTEKSWVMERDGIRVETNFGGSDQQFDPLTEIDEIVISYTVTRNNQITHYDFPEMLRRCSLQTFLALVSLSRRLEVVDLLGDLDLGTKLSADAASGRLVAILKRL